MPRFLSIAALLLAASCTQQTDPSAQANNEATADTAATTAAPEVPLLEGEWQLTKLDGRPVEGMSASFGGGKARISAGCNHRAWSFSQRKNIVSFAADPSGSSNCAASPNSDQEAAFHALDRATIAIFDKQGREASLSGNGGNVTLVRR
jgi:heat shock protein HslJ